ncbi:multidrug resistance-associated ABC transporter [Daedaleopsis nitida]|nr:multidrug resistance-associated ABC transporter [Daedaleopsis nitida]
MTFCGHASLLALSDACVRGFWSAILPTALVGILLLATVPPIHQVLKTLQKPFAVFLTLTEAEALLTGEDPENVEEDNVPKVPLWRTLVISSVSLVETLLWLGVGCYNLIVEPENAWNGWRDFLVAATWFYATLRPVVWPAATVPYDLLTLFGAHLVLGLVTLLGHVYDHYVHGMPMPTTFHLVVYIGNLLAVSGLFILVMNMPLRTPSKHIKEENIGKSVTPEDYTTAWGWASFRWVLPLFEKENLNEEDVWSLSPIMQTRPLYIKFSRTSGTLLRRLWASNSLDIILDFVLTMTSVVLNYAGPFFLKRILDALDVHGRNSERRATAFVYALLWYACSLAKAQADVQHLWLSRRASIRIRSELMAAIYDKSLKRKDFSGIVDEYAADQKANASGKKDPKGEEPKAGADIGKIVNLMSGDANRVSNVVSGIYFLYGGPFSVIVASVFLYQLLGWSAFAGFIVLILTAPLNNLIVKRSVRIQKGFSTARDKRMGVLNEMISAVKFIKFFAWEDRWNRRVLDAREVEVQWMIKERINSVLSSLVWVSAPILVSVTSLFVYVARGNELTIGIAFTAIALYQMLNSTLNFMPQNFSQALQAKVALDRIATYLDEEEVDAQVSTLKKGYVPPSEETEGNLKRFGISSGSFRWNVVKDKNNSSDRQATATSSGNGETAGQVPASQNNRFTLHIRDLDFPIGKLTVVTGPTGSGKTALLMAMLGEMTNVDTSATSKLHMSKNSSMVDEHGLSHTISYAAQTPWLRHQSIKDNILFGYPYEEERYNTVVECCALQPDLEILEDGDATEIGARGVTLSGGQKARVALARAVYAPTLFVLLDDPLSAVDSHTARFLFEKLLCGPLLAHRTVVLVTHHVDLVLPGAHYLVRMVDGQVDLQGEIARMRDQGVFDDITRFEEVQVHKEEQFAVEVDKNENPNAEIDEEAGDDKTGTVKKPRKLVEQEHRELGSVKWNIYNTYLKASSYWTWGIVLFLIILTQLLTIGEKIWIKIWAEAYGDSAAHAVPQFSYSYRAHEENHDILDDGLAHLHHAAMTRAPLPISFNTTKINLPPAQEHPYFYIGIFTAIALASAFVNITGTMVQYTGALMASRILFEKLLRSVVRATMRWHDSTPQGRMLNRFSKDVDTIDSSLASTVQQFNKSLSVFAISMLTIIVVFPLFVFPAVILGFFYYQASIAYLHTGRDLRRMEANTRSPIFATFSELLEGIVTVRAFSAEERFLNDLYKQVDLTTKMWYTFWMTNRWLFLTFDVLSATAILATTLLALSGYVDAGLAGICITSAMSFTNSVYWACRLWTALEVDLNSIERVVEYLDLPQEPPAVIESNRPPAYWPSSTSQNRDSMLVVDNLTVKYAPDLPDVLHGVSFALKARERIGLLGRTGSGKSTLAMSILRFIDPTAGKIVIDGIDICSIGLHDLRSRITFIPQDAPLFSGTLRENLDPFNEHTDAECLDVLERVQIISESQVASQRASRAASRLSNHKAPGPSGEGEASGSGAAAGEGSGAGAPAGDASCPGSASPVESEAKAAITLDTQVSPGGTNFSQGQRQLIAMARTLLRRSAIIVLDEATSSVDFATDAKIQATIREEFNDSLLLTVAHRLRTVIDYDRLIVLDKGELAEFDTPLNLIQKEGGIFRNMCLKSGTFGELEAAAKGNAERD